MAIDDPYTAWCLDEAVAEYVLRLQRGERLRQPDRDDAPRNNLELIAQLRAAGI